ncbi:alginate lyase family protein [Paenibacillus agaridevorans]|uniref:alginate lyase family protein n=1 Tax=Paenibacillus agaridevorans TaxID=171404 RepID=UPI001BE4937A|nr:alginate lyase family protein [Paenibacillus agaridevorans]
MGYKDLRHDPRYTQPLPLDESFLRDELDLERPGMEGVREKLNAGDIAGARDAYLALIASGATKRYYFEASDLPELADYSRKRYADDPEAVLALEEAELLLKSNFPLFKGRRIIFPEGTYDWNGWLFDSSQYQLHLTRFGYLKHLSRAYALTGNEAYPRCFNDMMKDFLIDNPMPKDGTFRSEHCTWDPLSVGVRLFVLPEPFMAMFGSPSFEPEVKMMMIKSFHQHGVYTRNYHASHGNHVCMQLRGLITLSLLLPELKDSRDWLAYGMKELPGYIRQNVYEDGVQFEASPNYHHIVMRDLYELVALLQKLGIPATEYDRTLEAMFDVLMHLMTPDGQLPRFGDTDVQSSHDLRAVMSLGAYLFNRPDYKYLGYEELPLSLLWRVGPGAPGSYAKLEARAPEATAACFPIGGYLTSRQDWGGEALYMAARAGVGVAGHAHADTLSVIALAGGRELLVDSGIGLFEWNKERKYVISTRAHNTVVVDGGDQHVRSAHWNTPQTAPCRIWDFRSTERYDYWFASHYGYTRYDDPVIHSRKVLFVKNRYWLIVDLLEARELHTYEQYFHLPPGAATADFGRGRVWTDREDGGNVLLAYPELASAQLSLESGLYFIHGEYHDKPVVKRTMQATGRAVMETVVLPCCGSATPKLELSRISAVSDGAELDRLDATALRIEGDGWTDEICLDHRGLRVADYLDHTGNPVTEGLLSKPTVREIEYGGRRGVDDVLLHSLT